jgi:hypothetical protein
MLALEYLLGVILFCGVFLLGDLMTEQSHRLSGSPARSPFPPESVRRILLYAGRIFQLVAVVWGFVDAVSVLVLVF